MVENGASTREKILAAALEAFADRGVEATSLDSVAAAVGVRKQTLLYWFPSKEQLLLGVIDHAVADLGARLGEAAAASGDSIQRRLVAVVDATFRLGTTNPELLAVVREVARLGPPASTHLAASIEPLVDVAAGALAQDRKDLDRVRRILLAAGAQVVGIVTEAEFRSDLGLPADLAWLRARRRELIESLTIDLG
jgi:AcrR family transcriptional regulator